MTNIEEGWLFARFELIARPGQGNRDFTHHARRTTGQDHDPIAHVDRLLDIMCDEYTRLLISARDPKQKILHV